MRLGFLNHSFLRFWIVSSGVCFVSSTGRPGCACYLVLIIKADCLLYSVHENCWFQVFFHQLSLFISPVSACLCIHYSGIIGPDLLVNPACQCVLAGNTADSGAVGGDMHGSHGANCFYWTIMVGCHGWLTGTHPQPSRGFIWTQEAWCTSVEGFPYANEYDVVSGLEGCTQQHLQCNCVGVTFGCVIDCVCTSCWKISKTVISGNAFTAL